MSGNITVVEHPLVQHKLTLLRRKQASTAEFRKLLWEIGLFLGYEAMSDLPLGRVPIETPVSTMEAPVIYGKKLAFISVLRAGDGLLAPMLELAPSARVGQIGLSRNEITLKPEKYYFKTPGNLDQRRTIVLDPMLATGNSAAYAIDEIKKAGARDLKFVCLLAAPAGVETFTKAHPDVPVVTAAIDYSLDDHGYIVPGLGDAGDRLFGTKKA
ncbi:uracil phosphoribosyltransferase [Eilatimonas milleporae]|uniref:Uracil phosphoribosyltransferase n=1 Tax=Eilatimonas milleporae TaxID=911205 RepID=A0A3M0CUS5_9PROT|nr:uracil phosphoribosyltransferase [Eilatimonas milleporae]RMB13058.1 uracil phosphoribosyltransferase [Eilatimonas milleporae]